MEDIIHYLKPQLAGLSVALYFVGMALKKTKIIKDEYIPFALGGIGIVLCAIWILGSYTFATWHDIAMGIFNAITQGILAAGMSTYTNQLIKQSVKRRQSGKDQ